jgi:hypothetical protein
MFRLSRRSMSARSFAEGNVHAFDQSQHPAGSAGNMRQCGMNSHGEKKQEEEEEEEGGSVQSDDGPRRQRIVRTVSETEAGPPRAGTADWDDEPPRLQFSQMVSIVLTRHCMHVIPLYYSKVARQLLYMTCSRVRKLTELATKLMLINCACVCVCVCVCACVCVCMVATAPRQTATPRRHSQQAKTAVASRFHPSEMPHLALLPHTTALPPPAAAARSRSRLQARSRGRQAPTKQVAALLLSLTALHSPLSQQLRRWWWWLRRRHHHQQLHMTRST